MKTEVLCNEINLTNTLQCIFESTLHNVDKICMTLGVLGRMDEDFVNNHGTFSCVVDYPLGINFTPARIHQILLAADRGIQCIDIVVNTHDLEAKNSAAITKDIRACATACDAKGVMIRPVIEYRVSDTDFVFDLCDKLQKMGICEIIVGTGAVVDDLLDNIIISKRIEKLLDVDVISCAPILCQEHYELFHQSEISGIRIKSFKVLNNLCIVE